MSRMRRAALTTAWALAFFGMAVNGSWAQTQAPATPPAQETTPEDEDMTSEVALTRSAIQTRRQALVSAVMTFEGKESEAFWPLYREYRHEMAKVGDRFVKLLDAYLANYDNLTDELATKGMNEYLSIERERNAVKSKYVKKFSKVMPARKVARFFHIDQKMDAVIAADLARTVPLAP